MIIRPPKQGDQPTIDRGIGQWVRRIVWTVRRLIAGDRAALGGGAGASLLPDARGGRGRADSEGQAARVPGQPPERAARPAGVARGDRPAGAVLGEEHPVRQSVRAAGHGCVRQHPDLPGAGGGRAGRAMLAQRRELRALSGRAGGGRRAGAVSRGDVALRSAAAAAQDGRGPHRAFGRGRARAGGSASCSCPWACTTRARRRSVRPSCCPSASRSRWRRFWRTTGRRAGHRCRAHRAHRRPARRGGDSGGDAADRRRDRAGGALDGRPGRAGRRPDDPATRHRRARELGAAYARMRARDPARVEPSWRRRAATGGRSSAWACAIPGRSSSSRCARARLPRRLGRLLLAAPLAVVGAVMGWIPYRLAGWVAGRVTRDDDLLGTVKLFARRAVPVPRLGRRGDRRRPSLWGRSGRCRPSWLGVATGYVALRFEEWLREAAEACAMSRCGRFGFSTAQRLVGAASRAGRHGRPGARRGALSALRIVDRFSANQPRRKSSRAASRELAREAADARSRRRAARRG